ncbi:MAG: CapA family protein [Roseburia sp.]
MDCFFFFLLAGCRQGETKLSEAAQSTEEESENGQTELNETIQGTEVENKARHVKASESDNESTQEKYDFTICFAGDISLDEKAVTTANLDANDGDISKCISEELIREMQQADLMCLNNEFTYSTNGSPLEGKAYTFRANPNRVEVLEELGGDVVGLANNHVYDYGKQALLDTFVTLEEAGIPYVGAGRNLEEAMEPYYTEIDGKTIAIVAASRAEKNKMTPQATETEPGILRCYDTELFLQEIAEAKEQADFVIAFVHWGTEYSTVLEEVQLSTGKEYLDAGADVIIGAHSHCLQEVEYYEGKPIFYSLGNYWFNGKTVDTMLVKLHFYGNENEQQLEAQIVPALQKNATTTIITDEVEKKAFFEKMEGISDQIEITSDGIVLPAEE